MIYKSLDEWNSLNNKYNMTVCDMGDLADMYYAGAFIEIKRDFDKAYDWYTKAANLGHIHSIRRLGNSYLDGYGVTKDREKAIEWFSKGAQLNDDYCKKKLERLNREVLNDDKSKDKRNN